MERRAVVKHYKNRWLVVAQELSVSTLMLKESVKIPSHDKKVITMDEHLKYASAADFQICSDIALERKLTEQLNSVYVANFACDGHAYSSKHMIGNLSIYEQEHKCFLQSFIRHSLCFSMLFNTSFQLCSFRAENVGCVVTAESLLAYYCEVQVKNYNSNFQIKIQYIQ
ncbi:hypothetical protein T01_13022 [Trichinella spiralis]|uniref:Uncharacterized protein n=1 Tax=Trichinella spiralis TaxID=6334 RepID=A0A0V1B846_TRISP|nr:hypothetical protein T01_13022 [Trichinella spiralis]